jgi:hypothetical protein
MELKQLVDKLMVDYGFYLKLKEDPAAALRGQGEEPKPEQIEALKKIDYKSLEDVATAFADKMT